MKWSLKNLINFIILNLKNLKMTDNLGDSQNTLASGQISLAESGNVKAKKSNVPPVLDA